MKKIFKTYGGNLKIPAIVLSRKKCARNFQAQLYYFDFNTLTETAYYQKHKNVATQQVKNKVSKSRSNNFEKKAFGKSQ